MRLRNLLCIFIISLTANAALAQKRQYTMAEAVNGLSTTLAPKSIKSPAWRPGTHEFYYRSPEGKLKVFNADNGDTALRGDMLSIKEGYVWRSGKTGYSITGDTLQLIDWETKKDDWIATPVKLEKGFSNIQFAPTGPAYAFTVNNNLYVGDGHDRPAAITNDADKNIVNGQAVHRNEFGIDKGIFFSPKGDYLAYYRMDQTMVEDYPVIDWSVTPAKAENVKYPMAGRKSHEVTLQIYNITTKETIPVKTEGPKDQYLTCVTWSPDERYIYIAILARDQNHLWLNQYDALTGEKVKTILQEKDDKYVEPQHPLAFLPGSNTQFIWWSQRDG